MENGTGSDADIPASGINRIRPLTLLVCGFDRVSVSLLLTATKVTTVAADALVAIINARMAEMRCTNWRAWRRL